LTPKPGLHHPVEEQDTREEASADAELPDESGDDETEGSTLGAPLSPVPTISDELHKEVCVPEISQPDWQHNVKDRIKHRTEVRRVGGLGKRLNSAKCNSIASAG
jgi:hypothetical protein